MDVMAKVFNPTVGMRFELHGARFEVSFVAHGSVRYAATAGGQVHQINFDRFIDLQSPARLLRLMLLLPAFPSTAAPAS